jgi:MoxR-like ATPase
MIRLRAGARTFQEKIMADHQGKKAATELAKALDSFNPEQFSSVSMTPLSATALVDYIRTLEQAKEQIPGVRMTAGESAAFNHLVSAWNEFVLLPVEHPDDLTEFRQGIHALQHMLLARPARRALRSSEEEYP